MRWIAQRSRLLLGKGKIIDPSVHQFTCDEFGGVFLPMQVSLATRRVLFLDHSQIMNSTALEITTLMSWSTCKNGSGLTMSEEFPCSCWADVTNQAKPCCSQENKKHRSVNSLLDKLFIYPCLCVFWNDDCRFKNISCLLFHSCIKKTNLSFKYKMAECLLKYKLLTTYEFLTKSFIFDIN